MWKSHCDILLSTKTRLINTVCRGMLNVKSSPHLTNWHSPICIVRMQSANFPPSKRTFLTSKVIRFLHDINKNTIPRSIRYIACEERRALYRFLYCIVLIVRFLVFVTGESAHSRSPISEPVNWFYWDIDEYCAGLVNRRKQFFCIE